MKRLLVALLLVPAALSAQSDAGSLHGRVTDPSGVALADVMVVAANNATALGRTVVTGADGTFRFLWLPPGTYTVTADLTGFASLTIRKVELHVGLNRRLDFTLKPSTVEEEITVTASSPLIETTSAFSTVIEQREIATLPLSRRRLANLASLAPGTTLAPDLLAIGLNGGSGRNVNFIVDGGDNNDDAIGGALQNFSIEAVQEFNIQTQQSKAEFGRTSGGVLTVVTKSGTNQFEGGAYEFHRPKDDEGRDQYGASAGGPIIKDRAHFFITAERMERDPTPLREDLLTAKASAGFNADQLLQLRYGMQRNSGHWAANLHSILAGHAWQIGSDAVNEALFHDSHFANRSAPERSAQVKRQFKDDFAWSRTLASMRHDFKVGANSIDEPVLDSDFTNTPMKQWSYYAQDDIAVNEKLTLNLGLRYDLWKGFDLDQRANPIWRALSTQTKYNESYLRPFRTDRGRLKNDTNNWGPRIAFSYDVHSETKRIVRGGFGRYYDFPYTAGTIRLGANDVASPSMATPYSDQFSLGYSWQMNPWLGLNLDLSHIRYHDLPYRFRANPIDPASGARRFPEFGDFRIWMGDGSAKYDGINISGHARFGDRFELLGFYTLSRAAGNILAGADDFRITAPEYQPDLLAVLDQSVDPYDPRCSACFGPLDTDARHRVTVSGFYRGPHGIDFSGILRYHSATPYTDWAGEDLNDDGFQFDLPAGVRRVNTLRGASFSQLDVRVAKTFDIFGGVKLIGEVFNLFNSKNEGGFVGNRASSAYRQPTFFAGDPGQGEQRLAQLGVRVAF